MSSTLFYSGIRLAGVQMVQYSCSRKEKVGEFHPNPFFSVVGQEYQSEIISEHVILGNDVLFKCSIPSFVVDFVQVDAWIDSDAESHYQSPIYGKLGLAVRIRLRTASFKGLLNVV